MPRWEDDRDTSRDEADRYEERADESSQDRIYRDMYEPWHPEPIDGHE